MLARNKAKKQHYRKNLVKAINVKHIVLVDDTDGGVTDVELSHFVHFVDPSEKTLQIVTV